MIMTDGPPLLRVGLVGCSWFALRAHVPALLQHEKRLGVRLCAVCSRTRKSMAKAEAKVHAAEPARDLRRHNKMEQMFADPDIDAVLLVLPIPLMPAAIEAALRAGKHVLSEKPAAPTLEACDKLLGVLRELGASAPLWMVLENWACKPSLVWMRERLQRVPSAEYSACTASITTRWQTRPESVRVAPRHRGVQRLPRTRERGSWTSVCIGRAPAAVRRAVAVLCMLIAFDVTSVSTAASSTTSSLHAWVTFEHCAAAATLSLSHGPPHAHRGASASPPPSIRIEGEKGSLCWWPSVAMAAPTGSDGTARHARVTLDRGRSGGGGGGSLSVEDDWVEGGVAATLEIAIAHVKRRVALGLPPCQPPPPRRPRLMAARAAASDATRRCATRRSCGRCVAHTSKGV